MNTSRQAFIIHAIVAILCFAVLTIALSVGPSSVSATSVTELAREEVENIAAAKNAKNIELIGMVGSSADSVAIQGDYAYVGEGPRLAILDISDPAAPVVVGRTPRLGELGYTAVAVAVSGQYAYVACGYAGMRVVDVSDPANPLLKGLLEIVTEAVDVAVAGQYAYVVDRFDGLMVVDVSDPHNPVAAGRYDPTDEIMGVAIDGNYAYLIGNPELQIVDISVPEQPTLAGSYDDPADSAVARGLTLHGNVAYLAGEPELQIIDISDPQQPARIGFYKDPREDVHASRVAVEADYAYVLWDAFNESGVLVINIADGQNPARESSYDTSSESAALTMSGEHLYIAHGHGGLEIADTSNPVELSPVGFYHTVGFANTVAVAGQYAYVGSWYALSVVDASDPVHPVVVGSMDIPARGIAVSGQYAYVGTEFALQVVDVSDPAAPTEVGSAPIRSVYDVKVVEPYAYVTNYDDFFIVDISDPANPVQVSRLDDFSATHRLDVAGDYAYIADNEAGLAVVDISDAERPFKAGSAATQNYAHGVAVAGHYAFVADAAGLRVIDVSDPLNPFEVGFFYTPGYANDVDVQTRYAYIADAYGGLRVIDVVLPTKPIERGFYDEVSAAIDVEAAGDYAYVAAGKDGFLILKFSDDLPQVILGDTASGTIYFDEFDEWCGTDVWGLTMPEAGYVLVDAQIRPVGGGGTVCLEGDGVSVCAPVAVSGKLSEFPDHVIVFQNLAAGHYNIRVAGYWSDPWQPVCFHYDLTVSSPLLVSAAGGYVEDAPMNVAGIEFQPGDILAHSELNNGDEQWRLLFDASDVGIKGNVNNIAVEGGMTNRLLLGLARSQELPDIGAVTPNDIIAFDPIQLGQDTWGNFRPVLHGNDHQLTTSGERIDALDGWTIGYEEDPIGRGCFGYPISVAGTAAVQTWGDNRMKQNDEDIFCKVYDEANGGWRPYDYFFDVDGRWDGPASEPAPGRVPGLPQEDVIAIAYNDREDEMYLTIRGQGKIWGHRVTGKDIFVIDYPSYSWGGVVWHGPDHGWRYAIDGFEYDGR